MDGVHPLWRGFFFFFSFLTNRRGNPLLNTLEGLLDDEPGADEPGNSDSLTHTLTPLLLLSFSSIDVDLEAARWRMWGNETWLLAKKIR